MIDVATSERDVRISVASDVDDASLPQFESLLTTIIAGDPRRITVDLTGCPYITSSVITALIEAQRKMPATFEVVIAPEGAVHRIFDVCGFIERNFLVRIAVGSDRTELID